MAAPPQPSPPVTPKSLREREQDALALARKHREDAFHSNRSRLSRRASIKREAERRFSPQQYEAHLTRRRLRGW